MILVSNLQIEKLMFLDFTYAYPEVDDLKLLHTANIMAQYLDNDEDGNVDNPFLISTLKSNKASLFIWKYESQISINAQDLGDDETLPSWHNVKYIPVNSASTTFLFSGVVLTKVCALTP